MNATHGGPDAQGVARWDFSTNSNACGPCPSALAALQAADAARYPDPAYTALREAVAAFHAVDVDRVVLAGSASEFIARFTAWVAREGGQRVWLPAMAYGDYAHAARAWGLQRVPDAAQADLAWLCEPSSPLGEPEPFAQGVAAKCARVVLDLAYEPLRLSGRCSLDPDVLQGVWQLWTPNKAMGLTGVRGAYAIAPVQAVALTGPVSVRNLGDQAVMRTVSATGVPVTALDFEEAALEPHLRMNLRLREDPRGGGEGRVLAESRDLDALRARFGAKAGQAFAARAGRAMAASGLRDFPQQAIPHEVPGEAGVPAYPALRDEGDTVALQVFADRAEAEAAHPRGVRRLLEIALADKVKQARKQLPVSPKTGLLYAAIESQERLRGDIGDAAMNAVLADGLEAIRDRAAFERRRDEAGKRLFGEAMERLKLAEAILSAVADLKPQLEAPLMGWARGNLDDLRAQLAALVHPGFLRETPADALAQLPRYVKAMRLRAERAVRDPARDQARMLEIKPFADALAQAVEDGVAGSADWQALRWDLEELRVSMFAQELGARAGVSPKKLAQRLQALRG